MKDEIRFKVIFDGKGNKGSIDANELITSTKGLFSLLEEIRLTVSPELPNLRLRIETGFKKGSFEIDFALLFANLKTIFSCQEASALANFCTIMGISVIGGSLGLLQLYKRLKGDPPKEVIPQENNHIKIVFQDNQEINIERNVFSLFKNPKAQKAIGDFIQPLRSDDTEVIKIKHNSEESFVTTREEAHYYDVKQPLENEKEIENIVVMSFKIRSLTFHPKNKWKLTDGQNTHYFEIKDQEFQKAVSDGKKSFSSDDMIVAQIRIRQWEEKGKLKISREIIKVIEHIKAPQNNNLPI